MKSMTGYGRAQGTVAQREVTVEVRCYNHRFKDVRMNLPRGWLALEVLVENLVREWVGRGRVECSIYSVSGTSSAGRPSLEMACAREYLRLYRELAREMWKETGTEEVPLLDLVARSEGVLVFEETIPDTDAGWLDLRGLIESALYQAEKMRLAEGKRLAREIDTLLAGMRRILGEIHRVIPEERVAVTERATKRIRELAGQAGVSEERLVQEMAVLAERMDATEELARMQSHVDQFKNLMTRPEPIGRELDFLLQEMHREVNTLSSKAHSAVVVSLAVSLKAEVEKIREQVQNVE